MPESIEPVLSIRNLTVDFPRAYGRIGLLQDVSLDIRPGECLGLVGESGSGKSLLGLTLLGLQSPNAEVSGSILFEGRELVGMRERDLQALRGRGFSMIYQDALTSLNPTMKVHRQLQQAVRNNPASAPGPRELLDAVKIRDVDRTLGSYPWELSGGQRQRVLIALAIAGQPRMVVADEPTTALDVTVQAQVMQLLAELRHDLGFGLLFITHDLGLVGSVADRIACLYAGQVAELGEVSKVLAEPNHPYMRGLLDSSRSLEEGHRRLVQIRGTVPTPHEFNAGCRFAGRCDRSTEVCWGAPPPELLPSPGDAGLVACHHPIKELTDVLV